MPKKKITLDEAFAVFEQHGLKVKVEAVQIDQPPVDLSAFLQDDTQPTALPEKVGNTQVKITLFSAHTVGNGGESIIKPDGSRDIINNGVQTYGPGVVTVPLHLVHHLLHQDMLARQGDEKMLDRTFRSFVILPRYNTVGMVQCGVQVSEDGGFNMSTFLGQLGNTNRITQL